MTKISTKLLLSFLCILTVLSGRAGSDEPFTGSRLSLADGSAQTYRYAVRRVPWTSGLQIYAGISTNASRWDKRLGELTNFFDAADLAGFPRPSFSGMPGLGIELNYHRNLDANISWKAGLLFDQQSIHFFNNRYQDTASVKFQQAGAQVFGVLSLSPRSRRFSSQLTFQPGLVYQRLFSESVSLGNQVDSLSPIPGFPLTSVYDLALNTINNNYLAAVARMEMLFGNRSGRIMFSFAIDGRFSLIKNYRYDSRISVENSFFPINIPASSSAFGMTTLRFSVGVIYKFNFDRRDKTPNPAGETK